MEYLFRKSALENEKKYTLQENQLAIIDLKTGNEKLVDLSNIVSVELKFLAKRSMPDAYLCRLKNKQGQKYLLSSQHYKGVASFEDRSTTYTPFVKALHQQLAHYPIQFKKGINGVLYWLSLVFFSGAGLLALIFAFAALIPYGIFIIAMLIFLFFRLKKHF